MTAQLGWTGDNGDPDNFFFLDGCTDGKPASNNIPKWCNAEFNDLLRKAARSRTRQAPNSICACRKIQQLLMTSSPSFCWRIRPCSRVWMRA